MTLQSGDPFRCGHIKTPENTYVEKGKTSSGGVRRTNVCRTCRAAKAKARRDLLKTDPRWLAKEAETSRKSRAKKRNAPEPSTVVLPQLGEWVRNSLCSTAFSHPPELFFSDKRMDQNRAASQCYDCPVMFECAQYAVDNKIEHGVWGGLTPSDRGHTRGRP